MEVTLTVKNDGVILESAAIAKRLTLILESMLKRLDSLDGTIKIKYLDGLVSILIVSQTIEKVLVIATLEECSKELKKCLGSRLSEALVEKESTSISQSSTAQQLGIEKSTLYSQGPYFHP